MINKEIQFEDIRPYYDSEVESVINELMADDSFLISIKRYIPSFKGFEDITTVKSFQEKVGYPIVKTIVDQTTENLSSTGIDNLQKNESYLFISNHRDIVLDSTFLNFLLIEGGLDTSQVAIGSNLLETPWVKAIVRLNKSFIVKRDVPVKDMYDTSLQLSSYIRKTLIDDKSSIWIAQREGRAKDSNDKTQPGLLKMLTLSGQNGVLEDIMNLNIVPVSISYEYDPCDVDKVRELYHKMKHNSYQKAENEDNQSMLKGIMGQKGNVHFSIVTGLNEELKGLKEVKNINELLKEIGIIIDKKIYKNYKLWPLNYVAYDLLNSSDEFSGQYSQEEKETFQKYMANQLKNIEGEKELLEKVFLGIYANPVKNVKDA